MNSSSHWPSWHEHYNGNPNVCFFIIFLCIRNVAKIMLPNNTLHNYVKKLKADVYIQTLELFLSEHFKFLTVAFFIS